MTARAAKTTEPTDDNVVELPQSDPSKPNLWQRIVAVQAEVDNIPKLGRAPAEMGGFEFIRDIEVYDAARALFAKHGIAYTVSQTDQSVTSYNRESKDKTGQTVTRTMFRSIVKIRIRLYNMDRPGEVEEIHWAGMSDDTSDRGLGSASTNAVKYALVKALLIGGEPGNDPDGRRLGGENGANLAKTGAPRKRVVDIPNLGCPECGEPLTMIYGERGRFVGHKTFPNSCRWRPGPSERARFEAAAPPDPEPPAEPPADPRTSTNDQELSPNFVDELRLLKRASDALGRDRVIALQSDSRFARRPDEATADWLSRLSPSQRFELRACLASALMPDPVMTDYEEMQ